MAAHASATFDQTFQPLAGGGSYAEHAAAMRRLGVAFPEQDRVPECPAACVYMMRWFAELNGQRQPSFSGAAPLSWTDIASWAGLKRLTLRPFEIRVLTLLDKLWRSAAVKAADRERAQDEARKGRR